MVWVWLALPSLVMWLMVLILPWQSWSTKESLDTEEESDTDLSDITVLIPARNEQDVIKSTLLSVISQGKNINIFLIDDQSTDNTVQEAKSTGYINLSILSGEPLSDGWTGKLWALEQGRQHATTKYTLLLDADIELCKGILAALLNKIESENLQLVSLMAFLKMESFWEKSLMPAFIYFFKLLYPFSISNSKSKLISAAAGGCILIETETLNRIGGFAILKDALIDDCTLAKCVKENHGRTWIGLTHSAVSIRHYGNLATIWEMVGRTAYTQLQYSISLLIICTILLISAFLLPSIILFIGDAIAVSIAAIALFLMVISYLPTLRYYRLNLFWALGLPMVATLFLCMTWSSAFRHWQGTGAIWKGRSYQ